MGENSRTGTLAFEGDQAVMRFQRRLPYPIDQVWAALTDPEQRAAWFGETTLEPWAGGTIEMTPQTPPPPEVARMTGKILVWDPPRVLEHEWNQKHVPNSVVRYELTADGAETILTFTHRGISEGTARGYIPGTHAFLDRLEAHLAGEKVPDWVTRYEEVAAAYE